MFTLLSAMLSGLSCRYRSRSFLDLEVVALRHQVAVLKRRYLKVGDWPYIAPQRRTRDLYSR